MSNYHYQPNCRHAYHREQRISTGPNLLGDKVTCLVEDLTCVKCGTHDLKVLAPDDKYYKKPIFKL